MRLISRSPLSCCHWRRRRSKDARRQSASDGLEVRQHFPSGSIWEIIQSSAHHQIQSEALRVISEHTTPCGKVDTAAVVKYYENRYGAYWHCIAGSHKTAWRLWYDEPSMLWLESPNQRLALFRRKPISNTEPPTASPEMVERFAKICTKAQKKWAKKPAQTQRPLIVRDDLMKKFGGWWHVVVGKTEEFSVSSVKDERPVELLFIADAFTFQAWLG